MARPLVAPKSKASKVALRGILFGGCLRVARYRCGVLLAALGGDAFEISALTEGLHRIFRQSLGTPPFADRRQHVGGERLPQAGFRMHQSALGLAAWQLFLID